MPIKSDQILFSAQSTNVPLSPCIAFDFILAGYDRVQARCSVIAKQVSDGGD